MKFNRLNLPPSLLKKNRNEKDVVHLKTCYVASTRIAEKKKKTGQTMTRQDSNFVLTGYK